MDTSLAAPPAVVPHAPTAPGERGPSWRWPLAMLHARTVLFALVQAAVAAGYALGGHPSAWEASVAWWPLSVCVTNVVCVLLLRALSRREGSSYAGLVGFAPGTVGRDLLATLGVLVLALPVAMAGNLGLATWLFGGIEQPLAMFVRPLPLGVASVCAVLFPLTIALSELPTYFGYVMPRLARLTGRRWLAVALSAFWLSAQHATLPLVFDGRFFMWRLLMFLPFALLLGAVLTWRPRLLPYLMGVHVLLDAPVAWQFFSVSH